MITHRSEIAGRQPSLECHLELKKSLMAQLQTVVGLYTHTQTGALELLKRIILLPTVHLFRQLY